MYIYNYRYTFNGKETDNESGTQDYGMRIYNPALAKFLSVDPLSREYPMLSPYQFASNCPISGVDLDGQEYYFAANGTLLGQIGKDTKVRITDDKNAERVSNAIHYANFYAMNAKIDGSSSYNFKLFSDINKSEADKLSKPVDITFEELNTRAFMSTLKETESGNNGALDYNAWNGVSKKTGKVNTYTDKSFEESSEDYADHPGKRSGGSAAGAYQIMKKSWVDPHVGAKAFGIENFSPKSQDKFILMTITKKLHAYNAVSTGDIVKAIKLTATEWRSLPGPKTQSTLDESAVKDIFKANIAKELRGESNIATPKGELTK